ncbi:ATP-binding cassette domain-containing protein [Pseudonocardia endophytica]|uniref:ATP-binding cassette subfamily C protein/ATP-binding cassette subfamily C protein CydC n=1 Tax=Pseudonocardia endophytica TaxID=401976 RepID=A0A4R1HSD0_PSEEN|nr:ATP-binding cassette domain-containing protein [Pseudonocardia endophytica]TCK25554.1 ATP-binding cassette subfamily C protein/ATP-binding cassette subfamily C protein CydC [Pseudonocardia endophytica]
MTRRLVLAGAAASAASLASVALVATAVWLVVTAGGRPGIAALSGAIVAVRALAVSAGLLRYVERLAGHDAVLAGLADRRARVVADLVPRSTTIARGRWVHRLVSDVDAVGDLVVRGVLPAVAVGLTGTAAVLLALVAGAPAAAVAITAGVVAVVALVPVAVRRAGARAEGIAVGREELSAAALEITRAGTDLAVFGALDRAERAAGACAARVGAAERTAAREQGVLRGVAGLTVAAALAGSVAGAAHLGPAWAAVVPVVVSAVLAEAFALLVAAPRLAVARAARRRLDSIGTGPVPAHGDGVPGGGTPHLRLRDPALDLDLPPGSRVLLSGPSGSGKSTLLAALWRVREPVGEYTLDGVDVRTLDPGAVRERVGGLWQDAHLPRSTLRDALLIARPGRSDDALRAALAAADLTPDVVDGGLDGALAEGAENLSGGQRRRLLVARTLLADHPVQLFDEPAEGLAPADADRLLHTLFTLRPPGRTVVVVSHHVPADLPAGVRHLTL